MIPTNYKASIRSKIGRTNNNNNMHASAKQKANAARKHAERTPDKTMRRRQSTLQLFVAKPSEELRDLYWAAEYGDTPGVEAILKQNPSIDADVPDAFGRTPIHIAVINEHAEIVELLLDKSNPVNLYEALLLAINHNYENITELILKHPTYRQYHNCWPELAAKLPETSPFSDDISPIILACQKNLFGIVHLLWQEGMRVPVPHDFDCACDRCAHECVNSDDPANNNSRDQLRHAKRRLNEYRALTSEAYISLTSSDPFQTAFELSRQMERRAAQEKHFKREYKELVNQLSRFVVKLLDNVRTHSELQTILNNHSVNQSPMALNDSASPPSVETSFFSPLAHLITQPPEIAQTKSYVKSEPLARLRVAIKYKQKEFVAHWSCQQELMRRWLRGFNQYQGRYGQWKIFLHLMLIVIAYPVLLFFHWIVPESKPGRLLTRPIVRFVSYSVSYLGFLVILCFITINPLQFYNEAENLSQIYATPTATLTNNSNPLIRGGRALSLNDTVYKYCKAYCRGRCITTTGININNSSNDVIISGIIGQLSPHYVKKICNYGRDFIIRPRGDNLTSWIVTIWLLGLFFRKLFEIFTRDIPNQLHQRWATICRSLFDFIDYAVLAILATSFGYRFYSYSKTADAVDFFLTRPINNTSLLELPAKLYWLNADRYYFHPLDPLTVSELLFAVGAVFSFSRLLYIFPVLEVFGPCYLALMRVINDIFAFFFVFLVVFAAFMIGTMNVYWYFNPDLRRLLQIDVNYQPEIPAQERFGNMELTFRTVFWSLFGLGESDYMNLRNFANGSMMWVERVGYIMYGGYSVVVVCVLLNMLIAMMANSYETIKINSEMEWKYARTILFLEYIPDYAATVPTPFNLIPNPRYMVQAFHRLIKQFRFNTLRKRDSRQVIIRKAPPSRPKPISECIHDDDDSSAAVATDGGHKRLSSRSSAPVGNNNNNRQDDEDDNQNQPQRTLLVHHGSPPGTLLQLQRDADAGTMNVSPEFNEVIHKIVRRFIMGLTIQGSSGTVDLEEIKQDISSFRFELFDVLANQQSSLSTPSSPSYVAAGTVVSADTLKPPDVNALSRSPQMLRRSFAPYRRRHLVPPSLDDTPVVMAEVGNEVGTNNLAINNRRLHNSRHLSFKRPVKALTPTSTVAPRLTYDGGPSVRIDRVDEES